MVALFRPGTDELPVLVAVFRVQMLSGVLGEVDGDVGLQAVDPLGWGLDVEVGQAAHELPRV